MALSALSLQAIPDSLADAIAFISQHSESVLSPGKREGLLLAAEEAFINICSHTFPEGNGEVKITCLAKDDAFVVEISDNGPAFNPLLLPDPDVLSDIEQRHIGGLGVHFIRHFTDQAEYSRKNDRNILCLTLYGKKGEEDIPDT